VAGLFLPIEKKDAVSVVKQYDYKMLREIEGSD
jgi:hypothetical protein